GNRISEIGDIKVNIYPNPFVDVVTIEFAIPKPGKTVIEITTITGDVIRTVDFGVLEANKSYLYKFKPENQMIGGAFVYKISSSDQMATGKLIMVK
ncbi:MAG: T9SS type A sorting domain-containing protein, partial [Bacteroidetes bacterium]|nr:T9SS type A sorting domain-containing protein [Bacteroidota bacterium]